MTSKANYIKTVQAFVMNLSNGKISLHLTPLNVNRKSISPAHKVINMGTI